MGLVMRHASEERGRLLMPKLKAFSSYLGRLLRPTIAVWRRFRQLSTRRLQHLNSSNRTTRAVHLDAEDHIWFNSSQ